MKLIRCHIDNFGKLRNVDIDFKSGINMLAKENGWGKTTFAYFIKVMFYGFDGKGKKAEAEIYNEKLKFKPWQGGSYGGWIEFESKDRSYIITRKFDANAVNSDKGDFLEIRDANTNLPTSVLGENIGQELFGMAADTFMRTIFIGQGKLETELTGEISARVGNLIEASGDMKNYEKADKNIKSEMDRLNPNKSNSELGKMEKTLNEDREYLRRQPDLEESLKFNVEKRNETHRQISQNQDKISELQARMGGLSRKKDLQSIRAKYEEICAQYKEKYQRYVTCSSKFKNRIPRMGEVKKMKELAFELQKKRARLEPLNRLEIEDKEQDRKEKWRKGLIIFAICFVVMVMVNNFRKQFVPEGDSLFWEILSTVIAVVGVVVEFFELKKKKRNIKEEQFASQYDKLYEEINADEKRIDEFLASIRLESGDILKQLDEIEANIRNYELSLEELDAISDRKEKYEQQNPSVLEEAVETPYDSDSLVELTSEIRKLQDQIDTFRKTEKYHGDQIESIERQLDNIQDIEVEYEELKKKCQEGRRRYDDLRLAKEMLSLAKESLGTRYMEPMLSSFYKYYDAIDNVDNTEYKMNAAGKIEARKEGLFRPLKAMSQGYQDLINFCMRMAMVDNMFEGEPVFVVLDDPFANLDDRRIEGARELLKLIAKDYQVLYFTCSDTRTVDS